MKNNSYRWKRLALSGGVLLVVTAGSFVAVYRAHVTTEGESERSAGIVPSKNPAQEMKPGEGAALGAAKRAETGYAGLCGDRSNRQCIRDEHLDLDDLDFLVQELQRTDDYRARDNLSWLLIDLVHAKITTETPIKAIEALMYHISWQENWDKITITPDYIHGEKLDKLTLIGIFPGESSRNLLLSLLEESEAAALAEIMAGPAGIIPFSGNFTKEIVGAAARGLAYKQDSEAYALIVRKLGRVYVQLRRKDWHLPNPVIGNDADREEFRHLYGMQNKLAIAISEFEAVKRYGADDFRRNFQSIDTLQFDPCLSVEECETFLEAQGAI